jgi:hypothetical protein
MSNIDSHIYHYPLTSLDADGKPNWRPGIAIRIPVMHPAVDTHCLPREQRHQDPGTGNRRNTDLTSMGMRIEVYHGWSACNATRPHLVISLTNASAKSITAADDYLFVGYVHTVPNIDALRSSGNAAQSASAVLVAAASSGVGMVGNDGAARARGTARMAIEAAWVRHSRSIH